VEDPDAISQRLVRQLYNPLEILTNLMYLVLDEPGDKNKVIEYAKLADAQVALLMKVARDLSCDAALSRPLEFIHSERMDGDLLLVDFSDGTQGAYRPEDLAAIGGKRRRSDTGFWGGADS
jgi:hypothetical protein